MAKSPKELLELTETDKKAIEAMEGIIDSSPEMAAFQGGEVKVAIPEAAVTEHLSYREILRRNALRDRYINAGWKQASFSGSGTKITFLLNQSLPYSGCGKD